ncbi:endolytic transglycosylase MltG [Haematospirillum jordaniae]|uniref:Endolytic murein transglycosylase n=1 Tax=Haematospirillum jordaniae TaxID=1549855 RepID=A0A143DDN0_9PROT|nr:hypothetical protein AY555_05875 [Haematospirillum jordaniae]NKD45465.1 endolytic transglycosylase MltG [Haematospirillum jordaniae]NKD56850.1 endolytic transglycosylase MltG [Haematospirillum jordaniae]NKD58994.1 endolytic transglycosylase MltG [Haematospirillum jordaniae]NKD66775.1 endolytic transglycosylase MltG [Haematospirillum jordaniae]
MGVVRFLGKLFFLCAGVLVVCAGIFAFRVHQRYGEPGLHEQDVVVLIPRGSGLAGIAERLHGAGLLPGRLDTEIFLLSARIDGRSASLKAGEYAIPAGASMAAVLDQLAAGTGMVRYPLTIPEGLTTAEVLSRVRDMAVLDGELTVSPGEGTLLPETWQIMRGDSRDAVVRRMMGAMDDTLEALWSQRVEGLPLQDRRQALILASVVEKETAVPGERPRVAAVFINRLRLGMPLQSDPTVIYGLSPDDGSLDRALLRKDLEQDHPWNTYTRPGLPVGPIANPGRESIAAVLAPAQTKDLYFVADGTGGHVFAETLDEHNRNVARWRKISRGKERADAR